MLQWIDITKYYIGCQYYGIDMPFHVIHNNINSALHWWEAEKGVELEMTLYSDGARQSHDLPILPSQMDWTTHVRITDHATTGVIQPDANKKEVTMFVVVEHTITDADSFFAAAARVAEAPSGIKGLQFFPSISKDRAICLWQADSIEALKGFLEPLSAQSSRNTYYEVDGKKAMGLPNLSAAA